MKKIAYGILAIWVLFNAQNSWAAQDISALVQRTLPGVAVVLAGNADAVKSLGSGFFVTAKGDVITNYHVIAGMSVFNVKTERGNIYPAQIRAYDKERDMAILATTVPASEYRVLSLAPQNPSIGVAVYAIGAPQGLEKSVSDGLVSQLRKIGDTQYIQISCPISPGSSGGPVLNNKGEVIGMATSSLTTGQNLNFAVPSTVLKPFIEYGKNVAPLQADESRSAARPPAEKPQARPSKERYVYLGGNDFSKWYMDTVSVKLDNDQARFWLIYKFDAETSLRISKQYAAKSDKNITTEAEMELNLRTKETRVLQSLMRGNNGEIIYKETQTSDWGFFYTNTPGAASYNYILEHYY